MIDMITTERAKDTDISEFIKNIRAMDKEEVILSSGESNIHVALQDWKNYNTLAVKCNGDLIGIGGYEEDTKDSKRARVWLLLTNEVVNHKIEFLRWSRKFVNSLLEKYEYLFNDVYLGNKLHTSYLKWLGAHFFIYNDNEDWAFFIMRKE